MDVISVEYASKFVQGFFGNLPPRLQKVVHLELRVEITSAIDEFRRRWQRDVERKVTAIEVKPSVN